MIEYRTTVNSLIINSKRLLNCCYDVDKQSDRQRFPVTWHGKWQWLLIVLFKYISDLKWTVMDTYTLYIIIHIYRTRVGRNTKWRWKCRRYRLIIVSNLYVNSPFHKIVIVLRTIDIHLPLKKIMFHSHYLVIPNN